MSARNGTALDNAGAPAPESICPPAATGGRCKGVGANAGAAYTAGGIDDKRKPGAAL